MIWFKVLLQQFDTGNWWTGTRTDHQSCITSEPIGGRKDSMFRKFKFPALDTLTMYSNISKIRIVVQIRLCEKVSIEMDRSKNNRFSAEEAINYIPRTEKKRRHQYVKCLKRLGLCPPPCFKFDHRSQKLKKIAYRGSSAIPTSFKLEMFC